MAITPAERAAMILAAQNRANIWELNARIAYEQQDAERGDRYQATADTYWRHAAELQENAPDPAVTFTAAPALVDVIARHTGETPGQVRDAMDRQGWTVADEEAPR